MKITAHITESGNFSNYVEIFGYGRDTNQSNNRASVNITAKPAVDRYTTKTVNVLVV